MRRLERALRRQGAIKTFRLQNFARNGRKLKCNRTLLVASTWKLSPYRVIIRDWIDGHIWCVKPSRLVAQRSSLSWKEKGKSRQYAENYKDDLVQRKYLRSGQSWKSWCSSRSFYYFWKRKHRIQSSWAALHRYHFHWCTVLQAVLSRWLRTAPKLNKSTERGQRCTRDSQWFQIRRGDRQDSVR